MKTKKLHFPRHCVCAWVCGGCEKYEIKTKHGHMALFVGSAKGVVPPHGGVWSNSYQLPGCGMAPGQSGSRESWVLGTLRLQFLPPSAHRPSLHTFWRCLIFRRSKMRFALDWRFGECEWEDTGQCECAVCALSMSCSLLRVCVCRSTCRCCRRALF